MKNLLTRLSRGSPSVARSNLTGEAGATNLPTTYGAGPFDRMKAGLPLDIGGSAPPRFLPPLPILLVCAAIRGRLGDARSTARRSAALRAEPLRVSVLRTAAAIAEPVTTLATFLFLFAACAAFAGA